MKMKRALWLAVVVGTSSAFVPPTSVAIAQSAGDLVGTWQLVSAVNTAKNGTSQTSSDRTRRA